MTVIATGPARGRYLVRAAADAVPLDGLLASIAADPGIAVVDRIGPAGHPHTLLLELSHDRARALEQSFKQTQQPFTIEPDQPLSMSASGPVQKGL